MPTIHRNLNRGGWTIKESSNAPAKPVSSAIARGITVKQPSGKKFTACRQHGAKRAVFAWFKCETVSELSLDTPLDGFVPPGATRTWRQWSPAHKPAPKRVRFNPKTDDFFHIEGERVDTLSLAIFLPNGECWGVR